MKRDSTVPGRFQERFSKADVGALHSMRLGRLIRLRAKIGSSRAALGEEAREDRLDKRTEDDLSATNVSD